MAVAAVVLLAGCGGDRELPVDRENHVIEGWERVTDVCDGVEVPTARETRRARAGLDEILDEYRRAPDATAQLGESDTPSPLARIIRGLGRAELPWWPECTPLSRRASRAVHARPRAYATAPPTTRASFTGGRVRRFAGIGALAVYCDRYARQFFTRFIPARAGMKVRVRLNVDGIRDDRVRFDHVPANGIQAPLATRGQSWRLRYKRRLAKAHLRLIRTGARCVG